MFIPYSKCIYIGSQIYSTNCVACHGDKGQGGVGPNLTDKF
ncbi:MAG: cytochrome c [Baekduiaceae bacterium]